MKRKEDLYHLIQSLSPVEKAYFKKQASGLKTESVYYKLFDELSNLHTYDHIRVKTIFERHSKNKNTSLISTYLFDAVLDAMHEFQSEKNIENQLDKKINRIKVLYNKGMYNACHSLLIHAKEMAEKNQLFIHQLKLSAFEYVFNQFRLQNPEGFFEREKNILNELLALNKSNEWYTAVMLWMQNHDRVQSEDERKEIDALYFSDNGYTNSNHIPFRGLNTIYAADTIYYYAIGDNKMAMNAKISQLENYFSNPHQRKANYRLFLLVYSNTLALLYNNKEARQFETLYRQLDSYLISNSPQKILEKEIKFSHGLNLYKLKEDYGGGIRFLLSVKEELLALENKISLIRFTDICFNAAVMFFWQKDLKESMRWLNRILDNPKVESRQYIYCYARIFELIIHLEAANNDLLQSRAASTFRYLYKRNKVHDFERIILGYLKKLLRASLKTQRKKVFADLKKELLIIQSDPAKASAMDHFDYVKWLGTKQ